MNTEHLQVEQELPSRILIFLFIFMEHRIDILLVCQLLYCLYDHEWVCVLVGGLLLFSQT